MSVDVTDSLAGNVTAWERNRAQSFCGTNARNIKETQKLRHNRTAIWEDISHPSGKSLHSHSNGDSLISSIS